MDVSLFDEFRATLPEFAEMLVPVTITTTTPGTHDRINDTFVAGSSTSRAGRGVLGKRKIQDDNGVWRTQAVCKLDSVVSAADVIVIGSLSRTVTDVDLIQPDGLTPFLCIAVVK